MSILWKSIAAAPADAASAVPAAKRQGACVTRSLQNALLIAVQLAGLWAFSMAGASVTAALALPIPGALAGLILLYALLSLGIVKVAWFDAAGSLLVKHLAFFFIPVAVGVMDAGGLLGQEGIGIAVTLLASAAFGIVLSGLVAQRLAGRTAQAREGS